jgi:SAM-dependent methyltransferase
VETTDAVVDLGAGTCEFINAIECADKIAVDLNPDVVHNIHDGKAIVARSDSMPEIPTGSVDVVFTSNFFEHLPNKPELVATLEECHRILRPDGRLMVVMPNIRYLPGRYWDYFDHHLALTHFSLVEALGLSGFRPEVVLPKFLPYTIKHSRMPRLLPLVRLYMRVPFLWRFVGKQMFVVGRRVVVPDGVSALD